MVDEIITALSRIRWLFVIADNSSFTYKGQAIDVKQIGRELGVRYVLEGSVRKDGRRVRISAVLIDATTGAHLWADRFDGSLEEIFDLQDQVAVSIAGVIEPTLQAAEIRHSVERPMTDLTAYDLYLRARSVASSYERGGIAEALELIGQAIARDPRYALALATAATYRVDLENYDWIDDREGEANRRTAVDLARQALGIGADDPGVLGRAAIVLGRFGEDINAALALIDRALALNPSFASAGIGAAGCGYSPVRRSWRSSTSRSRCVSIPAVRGASIWPGSAPLISSAIASRMPWRCCGFPSKRLRPSRQPTALWQPATRIWVGSTKPEKSSSGWRP